MRDPGSIPHRVHVVGAGGSGMSGLAKILSQLGREVTGSDVKPGRRLDALADVGIRTWIGHDPAQMVDVDLVVRSSAVPSSDPEIMAAAATGAIVWERPALLSALTSANPAVGLAGTHGKTTSSALTVRALRGSGRDPSFMVGGEIVGLNTGAHVGRDEPFVLEADEAFGTFRHLDLQAILVTNIEADHLDHYGTVASLEDAFAQVVDGVDGPRVACIDDPGVRRLVQRVDAVTYGFAPEATWRMTNLSHGDGGVAFALAGPKGAIDVSLPKPGSHLASNAAGVLAMLAELGHDLAGSAAALSTFEGVRRRFERMAEVGGIVIVDDYAHHPTEVAATIEAAVRAGNGRVIAVFQPHRYTRTADLGPDFGAPLALADEVIVTDVYPAGEEPIIGVSGRLVVQAVEAAGRKATYVERISEIPQLVTGLARDGDIVLLMGAGDITSVVGPLALALERTT